MQQRGVAMRKQTQIASANRTMFLWVAGVSVVFGVCLVGTIFLTQMLLFNERVIHEKDKTIAVLDNNNRVVSDLEKQVRVLDTNDALISAKAKPDDKAIQVILDALPSDANSLALGASLQNKLLAGINGLTLNTLQIDPVVGIESLGSENSVVNNAVSTSNIQNEITFRFSVSGDPTALKQALHNLELSIRTIDILSLKIENQGKAQMMTVQGRAFYEPTRIVKLRDKTVK
ncbi:hypothetical protein HGB25_01645 [Candidatus Saccharibacteria bacterium]|nr:hypothetical protein [Candidatus Saccharibacteria bacterium]